MKTVMCFVFMLLVGSLAYGNEFEKAAKDAHRNAVEYLKQGDLVRAEAEIVREESFSERRSTLRGRLYKALAAKGQRPIHPDFDDSAAAERREAAPAKKSADIDELAQAIMGVQTQLVYLDEDRRGIGAMICAGAADALAQKVAFAADKTAKAELQRRHKNAVACRNRNAALMSEGSRLNRQCDDLLGQMMKVERVPEGSDAYAVLKKLEKRALPCVTKLNAWKEKAEAQKPNIDEVASYY